MHKILLLSKTICQYINSNCIFILKLQNWNKEQRGTDRSNFGLYILWFVLCNPFDWKIGLLDISKISKGIAKTQHQNIQTKKTQQINS